MSGGGGSLLRGRPFHCREWALEKLRHWLEVQCAGVLVMGGPGAGKTALCTEVVWPATDAGLATGLAPLCLASHFCQPEDERTTSVWRFVLGVAEQLRGSPLLSPGYREALDTPAVASALDPLHCQQDPDDTFKRVVLQPLQDLPPPAHRLFLLVDSLDSGYPGGAGAGGGKSGSIAELLSSHLQLFPSWLLLICSTRRQNRAVCRLFSGFRKLPLDDLRKAPVVSDVQRYILQRLDQEGALRRHLTPETADMLNVLHIKSGGCFLFLQRVLDGVARGLVAVREIRDIPGTLSGLYLWLCQRILPRKLFSQVKPLLDVLLASPRPLTPEQLYVAAWTRDAKLSHADFQHKLNVLSTLLIDGPGGTKLLFHSSFAEWLTDVKYCTQKYLCSAEEGHVMLAMSLTLRAPQLSAEEVCQLASHMVSSNVHAGDPTLLALWMVWTGVASASCSPPFLPQCLAPVLVQQEVLHLLVKSGAYTPPCSSDYGPSVGVRCFEDGVGTSGRIPERVKYLLDSGASVNQADPADGRTLLASAAYAGSIDVIRLLLSRGASLELSDNQGQTPLILAARQGHVNVVRFLLDWIRRCGTEGARIVDHADGEGWTALRLAAWGGHTEVVRLLLDAGAEVDGCDMEGRTALRAAAWGGHEEILLTLLEHGAQVDKADQEGRTPLIAAAYMGHWEAVEILLEHGAQVDLQDGDGRTALSVAAMCVPSAAKGLRGYEDVVGLLLERGADPGHRDQDGMTPLMLAAYEGHKEVVELLLEAGADVDESAALRGSPSAGVTPLLAAASMGHVDVVSTVLFWGAAVDAIDAEGRTALSLAATRGSAEAVRALLDRGLDENHKDDMGWTPLHAAACEGHKGVCALLTERGSVARVGELDNEGRTPLILAAQEGHCSTVRLLLDRRSPIDHRDYNGHSALSAAALEGNTEVMELLMRRGADTDVRDAQARPLLYLLILEGRLDMAALLIEKGGVPLESRDMEGRTALHVACWQGNLEGMRLLLKHGADVNAQDREGRPPLHSVAWRGHGVAACLLLESKGVDVNLACTQQGATALCIAAQEGHTDLVAVLLEKGADPEHVDRYGRSPVKVAAKMGHVGIVRLLESCGAKPYTGTLPPLQCGNPQPSQSLTVNPPSLTSSGSNREATPWPLQAAVPSSSSPSWSPGSTAGRFHSTQSSQTSSSTCHSRATAQTVPADSLSFTQQIRQHSLPRSRSRPSTLLSPSSASDTLHGSGSSPRLQANPPSDSISTAVPSKLHKDVIPLGDCDYSIKPKTPENKSAGLEKEDKRQGKWNSVMASLGVTPGQDCPSRPPKTRESPLLGYPVQLQSQAQQEAQDGPRKSLPPAFSFPMGSSPSALPPESGVVLTTTDPELNLKQAIKLQFEGPTNDAVHKRETAL
ncbi:ankyrin repeat domain-containing protein 50-like [Megalops cyprinoides]|uniref:ankyrin repeat domain-containing protein 50-like n=1 Tax=Megalops cyprinoides TaxID=118141 RepID=UPI001863D36E|nr:ankyrin repeat domain-containing protein 50-like [Megalops cyprinoides]